MEKNLQETFDERGTRGGVCTCESVFSLVRFSKLGLRIIRGLQPVMMRALISDGPVGSHVCLEWERELKEPKKTVKAENSVWSFWGKVSDSLFNAKGWLPDWVSFSSAGANRKKKKTHLCLASTLHRAINIIAITRSNEE